MQVDAINAYSFTYPVSIGKGKNLSWVESRKPERYSSAAPLAPDARQRIVSERIDLKNNLVISVSVFCLTTYILRPFSFDLPFKCFIPLKVMSTLRQIVCIVHVYHPVDFQCWITA